MIGALPTSLPNKSMFCNNCQVGQNGYDGTRCWVCDGPMKAKLLFLNGWTNNAAGTIEGSLWEFS